MRAGIWVPDVALDYDFRDHRNATFKPSREVRVEQLRAEAGPSLCKLGALIDIHVVASEVEFGQHVPRKYVYVVHPYVVAIGYLLVQQSRKTTRSRNRLPEAAVARPHAVTVAELVVQSSAAFVLTGDGLGSVKPVVWVGGSGSEVWRREQGLRVLDHILVNHCARYLVAGRSPGGLNIARRWLGVPCRIAHESLPAVGIVDLPADSREIPRQLRRGWNVVLVGSGCMPSEAFVAEEEKCFPLRFAGHRNRTAESGAELILLELGLVGRQGLFGRS